MFWYEYFKDCWENGTVTQEQLQEAVTRGWITQEQYEEIIGG
jgi:uncharacterized XkdX family phage protein